MSDTASDRWGMDPTFTTPSFTFEGECAADAERILQAASLAFSILKHCGSTPSWEALLESLETAEPSEDDAKRATKFAELVVSEEQWEILEAYPVIVHAIGVKPSQTIAACGACGEWILLGEGTAPSKCMMTGPCLRSGGELQKMKSTLPKRKKTAQKPKADSDV